MALRRFVTLAVAFHATLGSACMVPMTMAAEPMPEMPMDGMMSSMEPMSHADCAHCTDLEAATETSPQSSSCADHCLSEAINANTVNLVAKISTVSVALPTAIVTLQWISAVNEPVPPTVSTSPPPLLTDSVVLRL